MAVSTVYLENKIVIRLQLQVQNGLLYMLFKVQVSLPGDFQGRKKVSDQAQENGHVLSHDLWDVEISQSSHEYLVLSSSWVSPFQRASLHQH